MNRAEWNELSLYAASHPFVLVFAELLRWMGPLVRVPGIGSVVNEPELAREMLMDTEAFDKTGPGSMGAVYAQVMGPYTLLALGGEEHRRLRTLLADLFSSAYIDRIQEEVLQPPLSRLRSSLEAGETVDLVQFMRLLTGRMTCHLLGVAAPPNREEETYDELYELGTRLSSGVTLTTTRLTSAAQTRARGLHERLTAYVADAYEHSAARPDSAVARLKEAGLSLEQVRGVAGSLLLTGTETTTTAVPRLLAILCDSGQLAGLRSRRELLDTAIDEGLRCTVPSPVMVRSVARDCEVRGHSFRAGERVVIFTYNVLKNGAHFPRPRHFSLERTYDPKLRRLWFGAGSRFCLGYGIAMREMRAVLGVLLDAGDIEVGRRSRARGVLIPAYSRLDIRVRR